MDGWEWEHLHRIGGGGEGRGGKMEDGGKGLTFEM